MGTGRVLFSRNGPELTLVNYYVPETGEETGNKSFCDTASDVSSGPETRSAWWLSVVN
jgi:hypothetical protein